MSETPSFLQGKAGEMAAANPSNPAPVAVEGRKRIPMSVPRRKLQVPDIPGYKLRWMMGSAARIEQALAGGYTFVQRGEVEMASVGLANSSASDGNTDLGNRVSLSAGGDAIEGTQGLRLYLMKLPEQFWNEDQAEIDSQHEELAAVLRGDEGVPAKGQDIDNTNRYVPKGAKNRSIFTPRTRRS